MRTTILLALALSAGSAAAEPAIGVFLDPSGQTICQVQPGFQVFQVHLFLSGSFELSGWEARVHWDPSLTFFGEQFFPGGLPLHITVYEPPGNYVVGLGACLSSGAALRIASLQFGWLVGPQPPNDLLFCVGASDPSTLGVPGYADCAQQVQPLALASGGSPDYPDGCAVLNPAGECPVAQRDRSWGALKSRY